MVVTQVFDCWFESGSMPYAYIHYPFENRELFEKNFPGNFVAEGLDQTRGWFVTLFQNSISYIISFIRQWWLESPFSSFSFFNYGWWWCFIIICYACCFLWHTCTDPERPIKSCLVVSTPFILPRTCSMALPNDLQLFWFCSLYIAELWQETWLW
jgi:hypothetical protein